MEPTRVDYARFGFGLIARLATWVLVFFIIGNAAIEALGDDEVALAIFEAAFFPITFFVYPFVAEGTYSAWPLADGTSLIPALVAAVVLYPISTFVGGFGTMEEDMRGGW